MSVTAGTVALALLLSVPAAAAVLVSAASLREGRAWTPGRALARAGPYGASSPSTMRASADPRSCGPTARQQLQPSPRHGTAALPALTTAANGCPELPAGPAAVHHGSAPGPVCPK
jgi:hypothetical protein